MKIIVEQKDLESGYYDDELLNEVLDTLDPLEVDVINEYDSDELDDDFDYDIVEEYFSYGDFE